MNEPTGSQEPGGGGPDNLAQALETMAGIAATLPEGSIERIAMERGIESFRIAARNRPTGDDSQAVALPEDIERTRETYRDFLHTRALMEEAGTSLEPFDTEVVRLLVNVRLRCPVSSELTGPVFVVRFGELIDVVRYNVTVECDHCGDRHQVVDSNAVVVPYDAEQIAKAKGNP